MCGHCISVFRSIVLFFFFISFVSVWMMCALKKDFVVHTKGVVLITGTSTGIGHHAAFTLAELGYNVFSCVRNEKSMQSLIEEAKKRGLENEIIPIILDVTNSTQIDSGVKEVTTYLSTTELPMVAIVNNAGLSGAVPLELESTEHLLKIFEINFFGSVFLTQKFLPLLRRDRGRLIFISSLGGLIPTYGMSTYASTKKAIEAVVDTLRLEVQPFGVSVSSLCPANIKSSIIDNSRANKVIPSDIQIKSYPKFYSKERDSGLDKEHNEAPTAEVTSTAIVDAIQNPFPATRYFMGTSKGVTAYPPYLFKSFVADRIYDTILSK